MNEEMNMEWMNMEWGESTAALGREKKRKDTEEINKGNWTGGKRKEKNPN